MSYLDTIKERKDKATSDKIMADGFAAIAKSIVPPENIIVDTAKLESATEELKKLTVYNAKASRKDASDIKDGLMKVVDAVNSIEMPEMHEMEMPEIPAPIVNVPKADFSPITKAIEGLKEEKGVDLDCFKAHDLTDGDIQYIGFLSPDNDWYIIENDVKKNSLRYVFGHGNYTQAFKKAASYKYELLSEAINAL